MRDKIKTTFGLSDKEAENINPSRSDTKETLEKETSRFIGEYLFGGFGHAFSENSLDEIQNNVFNSKKYQGINLLKSLSLDSSSENIIKIEQIIIIQKVIDSLNKQDGQLPFITIQMINYRKKGTKDILILSTDDFIEKIKDSNLSDEDVIFLKKSLTLADVGYGSDDIKKIQNINLCLTKAIDQSILERFGSENKVIDVKSRPGSSSTSIYTLGGKKSSVSSLKKTQKYPRDSNYVEDSQKVIQDIPEPKPGLLQRLSSNLSQALSRKNSVSSMTTVSEGLTPRSTSTKGSDAPKTKISLVKVKESNCHE